MLRITPQMKILVAIQPADFRRGIDGLARLYRETHQHDPFAGTGFVFRNRRGTAVKLLTELQRHADQFATRPERWLPWN